MKILVCIKQVPDTTDIKWTENNTMQREGVESIINPYDVYAIEEALKLKKKISGTEITVISMGPEQAKTILEEAVAIGCDNGVLLSDRKFAGADTYATSKTIAAAIKTYLNDFDLILCGQFAVDGDTAQTGPEIANCLDIPQVTYVKEIERVEDGSLIAKRELDEGIETVKAKLPALLCILQGTYEPTRPLIDDVIRAQKTSIATYNCADIGLSDEETGLKGSPTYVNRAYRMITEHNCDMAESVDALIGKIKEYSGV